jgi:dTDP-4-dehydrorhamnose reductase
MLPLIKGSENKNKDDHFYYKLEVLNLEGILKIKLPTIRESLEFTYSRFGGLKNIAKSSTSKGEGVTFV